MKPLYLKDIIEQLDAKLLHGDENTVVKYATVKPNRLRNCTLYIDKGKKTLSPAQMEAYKSLVIVTATGDKFHPWEDKICLVEVSDSSEAYWRFVDYYRSLFNIPIIGITGTSGKTTTKEMISHILSTHYTVHSTYKSQNGISLNLDYLLGINDSTQAAVFEMGVSWPNDLVHSIKHFRPQIRVLLNIGVHHLQGCKTPAKYFNAKAKILTEFNPATDVLILNADDANIKKLNVDQYKNNIVYFGFNKQADFQAVNASYVDGGMSFSLIHQDELYPVFVPGYGEHNVYNALAAIAAAAKAGLEIGKACKSIAAFNQLAEHLAFHTGAGGCLVIDDTWNNSSPAMAAALQVLKNTAGSRKKVALLGYMPQLGQSKYAKDQYAQMGVKAIEAGLDLLVVVGQEAREIGRKAIELGMIETKVHFCNHGMEIFPLLAPFLNKESIILLKITHRQMVEPSFVKLKTNLLE